MMLLFGFLFGMIAIVGLYFGLSGYLIVGIAVAMMLIQWAVGPAIIRYTTNMRKIELGEYPWIEQFVTDLCTKHKLKVPKLFVVNSGQPNAFVFGRTNSSATLV
jgi:heat shock protein HtpX